LYGTWNVRSLCRVGAIKSVLGELEKCKLDLVGVQEVRWEGEGYQIADMEKGMLITTSGEEFSYIRESFQQLKG
jgi:exonuclease III